MVLNDVETAYELACAAIDGGDMHGKHLVDVAVVAIGVFVESYRAEIGVDGRAELCSLPVTVFAACKTEIGSSGAGGTHFEREWRGHLLYRGYQYRALVKDSHIAKVFVVEIAHIEVEFAHHILHNVERLDNVYFVG